MSGISYIQLPLMPSKTILSMLRIYIANFLMSENGIESFTKESIDCLAIYIYKFMAMLMLKIKKILGNQGRVIGNFLHLLYACESLGYQLDSFIVYLEQKKNRDHLRRTNNIINKFETKRLVAKQNNLFEQQISETEHKNIFSIPLNYFTNSLLDKNPLPIRYPVCDYVKKPPFYSYATEELKINKNFDDERVLREQVYAQKQIKASLAKLHKQRILNSGKAIATYPIDWKRNENCQQTKTSFDLFKYL